MSATGVPVAGSKSAITAWWVGRSRFSGNSVTSLQPRPAEGAYPTIAPRMPPRWPREPTRGTSDASPAESSACAAARASRSASRSSSSSTTLRLRTSIAVLTVLLTEQCECPVGMVLRVEREEEDPLPLPEAEGLVHERDLLRARAEQ